MTILDTLLPIAVVVALGVVLRVRGWIGGDLSRQMNRLVFYVGMPPLLFIKAATAPVAYQEVGRILAVVIAVMLAAIVITGLGCRVFGVARPVGRAMVQAGFRSNTVFVGLPVVIYVAMDHPQLGGGLEATATLVIASLIPFLNIAAVLVLAGAGEDQRVRWSRQLLGIVSNPLIIGCATGVAAAVIGWEPPAFVERSCRALGQMALPLALLGIGASLRWEPVRRHFAPSLVAAVVKVGLCPLMGLLVAHAVGLSSQERFLAVLFLACPSAVNAYIMADQMGADAEVTASAIALSTLLAAIPLALLAAGGL